MNLWVVGRALWVAAGVGLEVAALVHGDGSPTLSELLWSLLHYPPLWFAAAGLMVWAAAHLLGFGRWV